MGVTDETKDLELTDATEEGNSDPAPAGFDEHAHVSPSTGQEVPATKQISR